MLGKLNQRQFMLASALVLTLLAAFFAPPKPEEEFVEANKVRSAKVTDGTSQIETLVQKSVVQWVKKRKWVTEKSSNLFPSKIKPLPPPIVLAPQIALPPSKPVAPPLPFAYIGKVIEEGKLTVFVSKQQQNYLLKGGEVIEGTYRVDKVESGRLVFTFLPLETEQVMTFGGKD